MFLAHFAAGLAASRLEPRLPLGTAFVAAQLPDAIWPCLLLAGVERVAIAPGDTTVTPLRFDYYPWSHSLVMVAIAGLLFTAVYGLMFRGSRAAFLLAPLAVSHWVLDAISHRPDVPIAPGRGTVIGLGLWESLPATLAVELGLFGAAVAFFAHGRRMRASFWALAGFLVVAYAAAVFGPPPPSVTALGLSMLPVVPLLWWWGNRAGSPTTT
jgi:hypothetical protein